MTSKIFAFAALGLATLAFASNALAGAADYEVQPVAVDVRNGAGSELAVARCV